MTPEDEQHELRDIGIDLLQFAREVETSARGLVTELFPYILSASKRMSTRAISAFLQEQHGVKISPVTIGRALKEPLKHLEAFADAVEPMARRFADAHEKSIESVLGSQDLFFHLRGDSPSIWMNSDDDARCSLDEYEEAAGFLADHWWEHSPEVRGMTLKIIEDQARESNEESGKEGSGHGK